MWVVVKFGGYFGIWGFNFGSYMDGIQVEGQVLELWFLRKLILGIWNVVLVLEVNWMGSDEIGDEFGLFAVGWLGNLEYLGEICVG